MSETKRSPRPTRGIVENRIKTPDPSKAELAHAIERLAEEFSTRARAEADYEAASIAMALHLLAASWSFGRTVEFGVALNGGGQ